MFYQKTEIVNAIEEATELQKATQHFKSIWHRLQITDECNVRGVTDG